MKTFYEHTTNIEGIDTHLIDKNLLKEKVKYTLEELKQIYRDMLSIRRIEDASQELFDEGKIRGFCHLVTGQESIYAAYRVAADKNDTSTSSYRCHGMSFATGDKASVILSELLGRERGMCGGKGGSMHLYNKNFYGGHGIVGASVPVGAGIAFKHKYEYLNKGDTLDKKCAKNVSFAFYGDGAANQGQIFEVYNMAGMWKLPVVFVCENNGYGMWTSIDTVSHEKNFHKRGGIIPGIQMSHDDVFDLISILRFCRNHVLENMPIILEIQTYRLCTHSARDQSDFRCESEVENRKKMDVLQRYREFLSRYMEEEQIDEIEKEVAREFQCAKKEALDSEEPVPSSLFTNVVLE